MGRPKKDYAPFSIRLERTVYDKLEEYCKETGRPKTDSAPVQENSAVQESVPVSEPKASSSNSAQETIKTPEPPKAQPKNETSKNSGHESRSPSKTVEKSVSKNEAKTETQPKMVEQQLAPSIDDLLAMQRAKTPSPRKKTAEEIWAELEAQEGNTSSSAPAA